MCPQVQLVQLKPVSPARVRGRSSAAKPPAADAHHGDAPPSPGSGRLTRSRLWVQSEEDLPFLDPPLEVDSQTPVADALIKRLKDEEEREGGWARSHSHFISDINDGGGGDLGLSSQQQTME